MADFCHDCSFELFGQDYGDFEELTKLGDQMAGLFACVLCEDCGYIQVDFRGRCIGGCDNKYHKYRFHVDK